MRRRADCPDDGDKIAEGRQCPKCGHINEPFLDYCSKCKRQLRHECSKRDDRDMVSEMHRERSPFNVTIEVPPGMPLAEFLAIEQGDRGEM